MRVFQKIMIPSIILLALIGLGFQLYTNPGRFFTNILIGVGVITIVVLIVQWFMRKRYTHPGLTQVQINNIQQSTKRNDKPIHAYKSPRRNRQRRIRSRRAPHLTVIEGNKGKGKTKKKNRALF